MKWRVKVFIAETSCDIDCEEDSEFEEVVEGMNDVHVGGGKAKLGEGVLAVEHVELGGVKNEWRVLFKGEKSLGILQYFAPKKFDGKVVVMLSGD